MTKPPPPPRLPEERLGRPTASRVVGLVVSLLLLVIGLNALADWYLRSHGTNRGYRMVHAKYDFLDELAGGEPADWLILGDSSGAHGVVPAAWSDAMDGETTHNLATLANLLVVNDAWMLHEYIERVGVPKNVVLVHAHDVWRRGYSTALIGQIPRPWAIWEWGRPRIPLTSAHVGTVALSRYLPLYSESETLRSHILHSGPPQPLDLKMTKRGWIPGKAHSESQVLRDSTRVIESLESRRFSMSRHNKAALKVLASTADQHGFDIYVAHAPMWATIARRPDFRTYVNAADDAIASETRSFQRLHAVSKVLTHPIADLEVCVDHVIPEQAPTYTRNLARAVTRYREAQGLDRPLPPIRTDFEPPQGVVIERPSEDDTISLLFGGDTSLARGVDRTIAMRGGDPGVVFEQMKSLFDSVDLTFLNLEFVLSDSKAQQARKRWKIRAPAGHARGLAAAGIDLVSVANNHTLDFGNQGFAATLDALETNGVGYVGLQYGEAQEQPVTIARVGDQTFGFLAYNDVAKWSPVKPNHWESYWPKPSNFDEKAVIADIERARDQVDHLVVSIHWGNEYSMLVEDDQRTAARAFIDAGAELIIGHHPHVPRMVESYKDGLIAYSLGDLMFDKTIPYKKVRNRRRYVLQVDYSAGRRSAFTLHPIHSLDDHIPYPKPELDVSSWTAPPIATPWRAADHVDEAVVARVFGEKQVPCATWRTGSPTARNHGYLKWLRPRWACADDTIKPWLTVGVSGDRSDAVFKRAIWAHPHPEGPLTLRFDDVPFGKTIGGLGGVPDWPLQLAGTEPQPPIELTVRIDGERVHSASFPYTAGWQDFTIDTAAHAGSTGSVEVQIEGGAAFETGFSFDLMVDAQP